MLLLLFVICATYVTALFYCLHVFVRALQSECPETWRLIGSPRPGLRVLTADFSKIRRLTRSGDFKRLSEPNASQVVRELRIRTRLMKLALILCLLPLIALEIYQQ